MSHPDTTTNPNDPMAKILLNDASEALSSSEDMKEKKTPVPNIFEGREEAQLGTENSKFPDWDILPPDRIINPRIPRN